MEGRTIIRKKKQGKRIKEDMSSIDVLIPFSILSNIQT